LVDDGDWQRYSIRNERIADLAAVLKETKLRRSDPAYSAAALVVGQDLGDCISLEELSKRAGISAELVQSLIPATHRCDLRDVKTVLADVLYAGYLENHRKQIGRIHQHDGLRIPEHFSYRELGGLSTEMVERLERAQPETFGAARRINGMTSAGLAALLVGLTIPASPA
jgi:tRNA uridine 5-carboxymethylaminomethyl modification enzyme